MILDHIFLAVTVILLLLNAILVTSYQKYPGISVISQSPADQKTDDKKWTRDAIQKMWAERKRMEMTPIHVVEPPGFQNAWHQMQIVFKNEAASRTGSLKHRYSWALMMWALLEQHVKKGTHVIEASSGNTACSLGYMCKMLGLKFTAIVPDTIELAKTKRVENMGGSVVRVPISDRLVRAAQLAHETGGFFMNQFKNAFHAEEFHESGSAEKQSANMMHEILKQLNGTSPDFFVHPAGTGGTISSIGRYAKKYDLDTEIVLADTQFSVYYDYVLNGSFTSESGASKWVSPGMAGIGYGSMGAARIAETTSLDPSVIDRVLKMPDLASTAAMRVARDVGIDGGTSTGVNLLAALHLAATWQSSQKPTAPDDNSNVRPLIIATILADSGKYYESTYLNREWISRKFEFHGGLEKYDCWVGVIRDSWQTGSDPFEEGLEKCK